jgi:hypothetical protein
MTTDKAVLADNIRDTITETLARHGAYAPALADDIEAMVNAILAGNTDLRVLHITEAATKYAMNGDEAMAAAMEQQAGNIWWGEVQRQLEHRARLAEYLTRIAASGQAV